MPPQDNLPRYPSNRKKLNLGNSLNFCALIVGVFLMIVVPPLLLKIVGLLMVCWGCVFLLRNSYWTYRWPRKRKVGIGVCVICLVLVISIPQFVKQWRTEVRSGSAPPTASAPVPQPVSIYLGCGIDQIPIHIPPASTIHVIRLEPTILKNSSIFASTGVFQDISAPGNKPRDWPSKTEGRWMTDSEMKHSNGVPWPFAFKCTISGYSTSVVEDLVATLIVETRDGKHHGYPVYFDPLTAGESFTFYIVDVCSSGIIPIDAQWGDWATLRLLGENGKRRVPFKYQRRNWPANLMPVMGPSAFLWDGMHDCNWDSK